MILMGSIRTLNIIAALKKQNQKTNIQVLKWLDSKFKLKVEKRIK